MRAVAAIRAVAGLLSLLFLALLVLSGWGLAAGYVPSDSEAFASVLYWRQAGGLGAFLRNLHHHLSFGLVVCGFLYLLTTYLGDRQRSRTAWWLALTGYLLVLGICFTGFLLPMDQNAYWGSIVRLGIVETSPGAGTAVADLLRGGATLNASTLPRFYTLHVSILPFACLVLLIPLLRSISLPERAVCLGVAGAGLAAAYVLAAFVQAPLELPADPTDSDYVPRPEWYFLWLFQFGKYVESVPWVRSLVLPLAGLGLLFALPLMKPRKATFRVALAGAWCLAWTGLTALALYEDRELPARLSYEAAMVHKAGENYRTHCRECHGDEGRGDGAESRAWDLDTPDFTGEEAWLESSHEERLEIVKNGKGEDMPAFRKQLTTEEIEAILEYLETTFRPFNPDRRNGTGP